MPQKTTKRKNIDSSIPLEAPQTTTASEPVQPEETQGFIEKSKEEFISVDLNESEEVDEYEPTPATPVESAHTTPSPVPRGRQEDEESEHFGADFQNLTHFHVGTHARDSDRSPRMKRKRRRTLRSTSRLSFIRTTKRRIKRSA
jgi:hypothetical protein